MKHMNVRYVIDREYDREMVFSMLGGGRTDPSGLERRARSMGIDDETLSQLSGAEQYTDAQTVIESLADERYEKHEDRLHKAQQEYQAAWDEIGHTFSGEIATLTGIPWTHTTYDVVLSVFHPGVSTHLGNRVVRWIFEEPKHQLRITEHELLMSHIWQYIVQQSGEDAIEKDYTAGKHLWALNEVTTNLILGSVEPINQLWPEPSQGYSNDRFLTNYPQLHRLQDDLLPLFIERKSFEDYYQKAIKLMREKYMETDFGQSIK